MAMSRYLYTSGRKKLEIRYTNNSSFVFTSPHELIRRVLPFVLAKQFFCQFQRDAQGNTRSETKSPSFDMLPQRREFPGFSLRTYGSFSVCMSGRSGNSASEMKHFVQRVGYIQHPTQDGLQNGRFPVEMDQAAGRIRHHPVLVCV
jgi:hypothetical protein